MGAGRDACEDGLGDRVFDVALESALQRAGAHLRVETLIGDELARRRSYRERIAHLPQAAENVRELDVYDLLYILLRKRIEIYLLVEAVQELRREHLT